MSLSSDPGPAQSQQVTQAPGLSATWTDPTGTALDKPDGTTVTVGGVVTAASVTVNNINNSLTATTVQDAIDQIAGPVTLRSSSYTFNGDGVTDDYQLGYAPLFSEAEALNTAGAVVTIEMQGAANGSSCASSVPLTLSGNININWGPVKLVTIGTVAARTRGAAFTHGTVGTRTFGWCLNFKALSNVSQQYLDGQYVGLQLICKAGVVADTWGEIHGFTYAVRRVADNADNAYNNANIGQLTACKYGINLRSRNNANSFSAENKFFGGNFETTTAMNNFGNTHAIVFDRAFDTDYANNSGNFFDGLCVQNSQTPIAYPTTGSLVVGQKYLVASISGIYLAANSLAVSGTRPTTSPVPTALTSITCVAGSNRVSLASTAGLVTGSHWKFWNPLDCFPDDTYISVFDGTHLDLFAADGTTPRPAFEATTTGKAYVTGIVTDGSAIVTYFEPYCANSVWYRDTGTSNFVKPSRAEKGFGGCGTVSGPWTFPESSSSAGKLAIEAHSFNQTQGVRLNPLFPRWTAATAYAVGDCVVRAVLDGFKWRCIKAGTSGATEPVVTSAAGLAFIDNSSVDWICVPLPQSNGSADFDVFCNGIYNIQVTVKSALVQPTQTATLPSLNLSLASANGWTCKGWSHGTTGAVQTNALPLASYALHQDGLILLSGSDFIGFELRTDQQKYWEIDKLYCAGYTTGIMMVHLLDQFGNIINRPANSEQYMPDILGNFSSNGAGSYVEPNGSIGQRVALWVSPQVYRVWIGFAVSGDSALAGCSVKVLPSRADNPTALIDAAAQVFNPVQLMSGARSSLGIPTQGWLPQNGEIIYNQSAVTGATTPEHFIVASSAAVALGGLAAAWATGVVRRGQAVTDAGGQYIANCKFTSATAPHLCTPDIPSGTNKNLLDASATSVQSGFAATWTRVGLTASIQSAANLT